MTSSKENQRDVARKELPCGWRWARLAEAAKVFAGSAAPQGKEFLDPKGPPFIRVSDLATQARTRCLLESVDRLSVKALKESSLVLAKRGTVIFPKSGGAVATNNRAILGTDAYIVSHLMAVEPTDEITSLWLYWALCQLDMMDYSDNEAYPSLKQSTVEGISIPLPPLTEQERLTAILTEQMASVERARAAAETQLEAAKALPGAYLHAVFNSQEAQEWPRKRLGDVGDIVSGVTLGRKITEGGDPDKLGRGTFWKEEITECIHQNHIFRVRFDQKSISPQFISAQIGSPYGKAYFLSHAKQTTGIATINQKVLAGFSLMIPSLEEQQHIASSLEEQIAIAERTCEELVNRLDTINKLPVALLRRAFNGEL